MNKIWPVLCTFFLLASATVTPCQEPLKKYWQKRFGASAVEEHEVEGLSERISEGELHLKVCEFLALVLKNLADVQVTRLDVYTAADQIVSAKNPFDPTLNFGFSAIRSVSPLSYAISGSPSGGQFQLPGTINSLSQTLPSTTLSCFQQASALKQHSMPIAAQAIATSFLRYLAC